MEPHDLEILQLFAESGKADLTVINEALTNMLTASGHLFDDQRDEYNNNNYNVDGYFNSVFKPFFIILLKLPIEYPQVCAFLNYFKFNLFIKKFLF